MGEKEKTTPEMTQGAVIPNWVGIFRTVANAFRKLIRIRELGVIILRISPRVALYSVTG